MKKFALTAFAGLLVFSLSNVHAERGNKPCSGKKGGISHCTATGKFVCKNGTLSASKKKCVGRSRFVKK